MSRSFAASTMSERGASQSRALGALRGVHEYICTIPAHSLQTAMPEISRFLGIVVGMFYNDHAPPHFHARYGEYEVIVRIDYGSVQGEFPRRVLAHVLEWYGLHHEELAENWERARARRPLRTIAPLE